MKTFLTCSIFLFITAFALAQNSTEATSEKEEVKKVIETFFEGFHARDSIVMKSAFHEESVIQTIGRTKEGDFKLVNEELGKLLRGIVSIPLETEFKEVLHDFEIKIDGEMANVWTPYSFYLNNTFSHCGVNNFQLLKQNGEWKIIYLIDTRRREGCEERKLK